MILYVLVALWPLLIMSIYNQKLTSIGLQVETLRFKYIFLAALPMFLLIGLRNEDLGADTFVYMEHFRGLQTKDLREAIEESRMEAGYISFAKYVGMIFPSPKIYQVLCTIIYMFGYLSFAKELRGSAPFYFLFFIVTIGTFTFMFTGIRQCLAISICLFSYRFLIRKKYWIFIPLVFLAYSFHKSALLFLFPLLIWNRQFNFKYFSLYLIALYLASTYLFSIQMMINEQFEYEYAIEDVGNGQVFLIILLILSGLSYITLSKEKKVNRDLLPLFNINVITLFFWVLRLQTRVAERPSFYFLPISCALFSYMLAEKPKVSIVKYGVILFSLALFIYRMSTNFVSLVPYKVF